MKTQLAVTLRLVFSLLIATTFAGCQQEEFFEKDFSATMGIDTQTPGLPGNEVIVVETEDGSGTGSTPGGETTVVPTTPTDPTPTEPTIPSEPVVVVPKDCGDVKNGETISRVQYKAATVSFGLFCQEETQTSTCNDGVLSDWTGSFTNASCSILAPSNCGSVAHGSSETRLMYQNSEVAYGSSCSSEAQTRTCNNGTFTAWSGSFQNNTCIVASPSVKQVTEQFTQNSSQKGKVDILWVVDNSGSMGDEQDELAYNFDQFINNFLKEDVSFKMGITTTDPRSQYSGLSRCSFNKLTTEAAKTNENQFIADFKQCIRVGTNGYYREAGLTTSRDFMIRYAANFVREDAYLIVVLISDEKEQSSGTVKSYIDQIKSYKSNPGLLKMYSIVNLTSAPRYIEAADRTGGKKADIKSNFAETLKNMGEKIVELSSSFALKSLPYDSEIVVKVDGKVMTSGWTIDTESGTLKFAADSVPNEGASITITYNALVQ